MVKVWCKFDQNQTKAMQVIQQKPRNVEDNTGPSASFFSPNKHALSNVKVWCKSNLIKLDKRHLSYSTKTFNMLTERPTG